MRTTRPSHEIDGLLEMVLALRRKSGYKIRLYCHARNLFPELLHITVEFLYGTFPSHIRQYLVAARLHGNVCKSVELFALQFLGKSVKAPMEMLWIYHTYPDLEITLQLRYPSHQCRNVRAAVDSIGTDILRRKLYLLCAHHCALRNCI